MSRITVLGSGAWGTAMALSLCGRGDHEVTLWSNRADHAAALESNRANLRYLPGVSLPAVSYTHLTGELTGLCGDMKINIADGKHSYEFEYTMATIQ